MKKIIFLSIPIIIIGIFALIFSSNIEIENYEETPSNYEEIRIAFIGDQGGSEFLSNDIEVLKLIKNENVDLVIHQGDLGFEPASPTEWDERISKYLGTDFLYVFSQGHHDQETTWNEYQEKMNERIEKNSNISCEGNLGVKSFCNYKDVYFTLMAPGEYTSDSDFELYVENKFSESDSFWKICSMHNEFTAMEFEKKSGKTGMEVFEACKNAGAIIATGHLHFYSRTGNIVEFIDSKKYVTDPEWDKLNKLKTSYGSSFIFISGLGGSPISSEIYNEWPINYSSTQNATYGGLFCTFNAGGQPNKAFCYFKNIDERIIDEFTITSFLKPFSNNSDFLDIEFKNGDLSGKNLAGKVLTDLDLSNIKLTNADLSNSILIGTKLVGADLTNADLSGVSLSNTDLTEANLSGADLTDTNLSGKDLSGMDLTGSDLTGSDLTGVNLSGMDLTKVNFDMTDLSGKKISDSNFDFVSLKDTKMDNVDFSHTVMREVDLTKIKNKDLSNSNLFRTAITFSNLKNIDISNTAISESNLHNSDLSEIDFTKIKDKFIQRVNFVDAKLVDANFSGMKFVEKNSDGLMKVEISSPINNKIFEKIEGLEINEMQTLLNYSNNELTQFLWDGNFYAALVVDKKIVDGVLKIYYVNSVQFQDANLTNADFSNADLTYALFFNTNLNEADFSNANLTGANLTGANLTGANLTGANLKCINHEICE